MERCVKMPLSFRIASHYNNKKMCEVREMEAILSPLADGEKRICIEWKQLSAVILMAIAVTLLCLCASKSREVLPTKAKAVMGVGSTEKTVQIDEALKALKLMNLKESDQLSEENALWDNTFLVLPKKSEEKVFSQKISTIAEMKEITKKNSHSRAVQKQSERTDKSIVSELKSPEEAVKREDLSLVGNISLELYGNGGLPECQKGSCKVEEFEIEKYEQPERLGKLFDGWYLDQTCSMPFQTIEENMTSLKLYAGWKEFPGFLSNEKGHIIGYTDTSRFLGDNLLVLPSYKTCTGIEKDALNGLEDEIFEMYIPANITYIDMDMFQKFSNLIYIQVQSGNPEFYSESGKLYYKNGELAIIPKGME